MPRAASLAAEIKKVKGMDAKLIQGKGGVFDVVLDGQLIFSKKQQGRFPEPDEVLAKIPA